MMQIVQKKGLQIQYQENVSNILLQRAHDWVGPQSQIIDFYTFENPAFVYKVRLYEDSCFLFQGVNKMPPKSMRHYNVRIVINICGTEGVLMELCCQTWRKVLCSCASRLLCAPSIRGQKRPKTSSPSLCAGSDGWPSLLEGNFITTVFISSSISLTEWWMPSRCKGNWEFRRKKYPSPWTFWAMKCLWKHAALAGRKRQTWGDQHFQALIDAWIEPRY